MNEKSLKEKSAMAVVGVVVLYAIAAGMWFTSSQAAWKDARERYNSACDRHQKEEKLISRKREFSEAYDAAKAAMPLFEIGQATDTTWLSKVGSLAATNNVWVRETKPGKESESNNLDLANDIKELPIELSNWEGSLSSLVKFMYALETCPDGLFDIRTLTISPLSGHAGYLKGNMSLTCAYMRSNDEVGAAKR